MAFSTGCERISRARRASQRERDCSRRPLGERSADVLNTSVPRFAERSGHSKQMNFLQSLAQQFAGKPIDWDKLEESLIRADLGVPMTTRIIKTLQEREVWSLMGISDVVKVVRAEIARILPSNPPPIRPLPAKPKVILLLWVNGTGKTTSTAKLAHYLQR